MLNAGLPGQAPHSLNRAGRGLLRDCKVHHERKELLTRYRWINLEAQLQRCARGGWTLRRILVLSLADEETPR